MDVAGSWEGMWMMASFVNGCRMGYRVYVGGVLVLTFVNNEGEGRKGGVVL